MNLPLYGKLKIPVALIVLASVLGVFVLNIFPAKAQEADVEKAKADINQAITQMERMADELRGIQNYSFNIGKARAAGRAEGEIRDLINKVRASYNEATKGKTTFEAVRAFAMTKLLGAKQIAQNFDKKYAANVLEESEKENVPWYYYILHPGEAALLMAANLLNGVVVLLSKLIALGGAMVEGVINWSEFAEAPIVKEGWKIVRDFTNILFVWVLLIIAFATILRIETYGMKALLPKLVIAALLVNFSLVLAVMPLNFTNILTVYFVNSMGGEGFSAKIADSLNLAEIFAQKKGVSVGEGFEALLNVLGGLIVAVIFSIIILFVFLVLTILLIIRIVVIWFLLIIAPIVFLLWIMPNTRHLFTKWWNKLFQWIFFAPVYAFFLFLALKTYRNLIDAKITSAITARDYSQLTPSILSGENILQFILMIGILLGGLIAAQKMGIYGASGLVRFGRGATRTVGGAVDKWLAKGAEKKGEGWRKVPAALRRAGSYLSPTAWKRAWEERAKEKERAAYPVAAGKRQDFLNRLLTWRTLYRPDVSIKRAIQDIKAGRAPRLGAGEITDYEERAKRRRRIEERKDIPTPMSAEEGIRGFKDAERAREGFKMAAYAQALIEQGDLNELFDSYRDEKMTWSPAGLKYFADTHLAPVMGEQEAYSQTHDLGRIAETMGQWETGRKFKYEPDKKIWETVSDEEAERESYIQWSKQEPQWQARMTHRLGYIEEGWGYHIDPVTKKKVWGSHDLGVPLGGQLRISGLSPTEAPRRMQDQPMILLMTKHAEEVRDLNPELYKKLYEKLKAMDPKQIGELAKQIKPVAEGVRTSSWENVPPPPEKGEEKTEKTPSETFGRGMGQT